MLNGKKTYILAALGLMAGILVYAQSVIANGFSLDGLFQFINSEAIIGAIATLRLALSKKA